VLEERRKYVRLDAKVSVKYRILERGQPIKESGSKDIGGGGIRLHLNEYLSKDTPLELEITLPAEPKPILAEGLVVWSKEVGKEGGGGVGQWYDTGIMFTKIDSISRGKILKYVYGRIY